MFFVVVCSFDLMEVFGGARDGGVEKIVNVNRANTPIGDE
jgi:hypothetical protein